MQPSDAAIINMAEEGKPHACDNTSAAESDKSNNTPNCNTDDTKRNVADSADTEDYGYDFFSERKGRKDTSILSRLFEGRSAARGFKCVANAYWCAKNDPMVKLMMGALKTYGCPVDLTRHVSCEDCLSRVNGGFDPQEKQVVICQNNSTKRAVACSVMAHELTHMFDFCRAKVDFKNLEHLACTEIRAANFMHCSFLAAFGDGDASPVNVRQRHRVCVRRKALMSILMVRNVGLEEAQKAVDKVFDKCYNDLEPVGRRPRRNSRDRDRALAESYMYGYSCR